MAPVLKFDKEKNGLEFFPFIYQLTLILKRDNLLISLNQEQKKHNLYITHLTKNSLLFKITFKESIVCISYSCESIVLIFYLTLHVRFYQYVTKIIFPRNQNVGCYPVIRLWWIFVLQELTKDVIRFQ